MSPAQYLARGSAGCMVAVNDGSANWSALQRRLRVTLIAAASLLSDVPCEGAVELSAAIVCPEDLVVRTEGGNTADLGTHQLLLPTAEVSLPLELVQVLRVLGLWFQRLGPTRQFADKALIGPAGDVGPSPAAADFSVLLEGRVGR